jgi:hypothetical protein
MWRTWFDPTEPHLARGPFTLWPLAADSALAVGVFVTSVIAVAVAVAVSALGDGEEFTVAAITDRPTAGFALLALSAAALMWRRRQPVLVTDFVFAIIIIWAVAGYGDGQDLALIVAIYSVGRYTADHRTSLAKVAVATAIDMFGTIIESHQSIDIAPATSSPSSPGTWGVGSAYRIVQESCTNIIRHAGPDPMVDIAVGFDDRDLVIDITNGTARTTVTTGPGLPASGYGIIGMRERAQLLGGTLVAEPQPPGRYRVHARLPIEPEPT